jgi:uncharacterized membrane protein
MDTPMPEAIAERLEQADVIDPLSQAAQRVARAAIPPGSPAKDALSGKWLGHPLHPPLTDVVIGCWTSAVLLDVLGGPRSWRAADRLVGLGVLAALPTTAAGLADWTDLEGPARRVGSFHAMGNSIALGAFSMSWLARRRGQRVRGMALALAGMGVATASAWLGGHLSFGLGVGVRSQPD